MHRFHQSPSSTIWLGQDGFRIPNALWHSARTPGTIGSTGAPRTGLLTLRGPVVSLSDASNGRTASQPFGLSPLAHHPQLTEASQPGEAIYSHSPRHPDFQTSTRYLRRRFSTWF